MRDRLAQRVTFDWPGGTLKGAAKYLTDHYDMTVLIDNEAFKADLMIPDADNTHVKLPKLVNVRLSTVLGLLSNQAQGKYLVLPDYVLVTSPQQATPEEWPWEAMTPDSSLRRARCLIPMVNATFEKAGLDEALQEVSHQSGITILLDARLTEQAHQTKVTAVLNNVGARHGRVPADEHEQPKGRRRRQRPVCDRQG